MSSVDRIADAIDKLRIFPRIALSVMIWILIDAYLYAKVNIESDDMQWFVNIVIGTIIGGIFSYMATGRQK